MHGDSYLCFLFLMVFCQNMSSAENSLTWGSVGFSSTALSRTTPQHPPEGTPTALAQS